MERTFNIYIAESVYQKAADGYHHKNTTSLVKVAEGLKDFTLDCCPVIKALKAEMVAKGATETSLSRSENWCEDHLIRPATDKDTERDTMFPDLIEVDIITTTYTLGLKEA